MKTPLLVALVSLAGCVASTHPTQSSTLGTLSSTDALLAVIDTPGPVEFETIASADWEVDRSGLINLKHEKAKAAKLEDGAEPIQIFFHTLKHPTQGLFIVDTGVQVALRDKPESTAMKGLVASAMHLEKLKVREPLADWLAKQHEPLKGVLLTHLHADHVMGLPDAPADAEVYAGPGETRARGFLNLFVQRVTDQQLAGKRALNEWVFQGDTSGRFEGVLDVFGDGSVWALWVPGHTAGSTAYLVRTTKGPVLLTGDACHTRWGWENAVEPGTFSTDVARSVKSLVALERLAAEHPSMVVHVGHQER